jgi:hypothetical protein
MEGLLEALELHKTDIIPAELPGIQLTSDSNDVQVVQPWSITEDEIMVAAMANDNRTPSQELA